MAFNVERRRPSIRPASSQPLTEDRKKVLSNTLLDMLIDAFGPKLPTISPPTRPPLDLSGAKRFVHEVDCDAPYDGAPTHYAAEIDGNPDDVRQVRVPTHLVGTCDYLASFDEIAGLAEERDGELIVVAVWAGRNFTDGFGNHYAADDYEPISVVSETVN